MKKNKLVRITGSRTFIRYVECPMFKNCKDVEVDLPVLPLPGNLFDGFYFLDDENRNICSAQQIRFFVADVQHAFIETIQYVIIVLQVMPLANEPAPQINN